MNEEYGDDQLAPVAKLRAWFSGIESYNDGHMPDDQVVLAVKNHAARVQVTAGDIRAILSQCEGV